MLPGLRQWDLSLKEELKTSTKFSLLSINSVMWAKERHYSQLKPVQDRVVAERHNRSWVRGGDAVATRCVRSAHGSDQALTLAYSFAALGFNVFLNLNPTYHTVAQ